MSPVTDEHITRAAAALRRGELVGMPTETVYGLAGDATNATAIARIFDAKARPRFDPLIVHAATAEQAWALVDDVPDEARQLADAFWPGPLTLVLPRRDAASADLVSAGLGTTAVRVPGHPIARRLIDAAGVPLAAPSANRFGSISPTTAQHVRDELGDKVASVLDAGPCEGGLESTVVGFENGGTHPVVYRLGGLMVDDIEACLGGAVEVRTSSSRPQAPGMVSRHYAPRTPLVLVDTLADAITLRDASVGLLLPQGEPSDGDGFGAAEVLAAKGNLVSAAAELFAAMRRLDARTLDRIVAVRAPAVGLGPAINDRLTRAAAPAE